MLYFYFVFFFFFLIFVLDFCCFSSEFFIQIFFNWQATTSYWIFLLKKIFWIAMLWFVYNWWHCITYRTIFFFLYYLRNNFANFFLLLIEILKLHRNLHFVFLYHCYFLHFFCCSSFLRIFTNIVVS